MPHLSSNHLNAIISLVEPRCRTENQRQTLIDAIFWRSETRPDIDISGAPGEFTRRLIFRLIDYGQIRYGIPSLWALLEEIQSEVGIDKQAQIDALKPDILALSPIVDYMIATEGGKLIFLCYASADRTFADRLRADLSAAGLNLWMDQVGLKVGTPNWEEAIRDALNRADGVLLIASPASRQSNAVRGELAIANDNRKPIYPVWASGDIWSNSIPLDFISRQYVDLRGDKYWAGLRHLINDLSETHPKIGQTDDQQPALPSDFVPRNPYKGLKAFHAGDRGDFFGRELLVETLMTHLHQDPRFLAVIGASGSGKSSVMMAGLLPRLREHPVSQRWIYLDPFVPGKSPIEALSIVLARHLSLIPSEIEKELLQQHTRGLHRLAKQISKTRLVVYIDQFEELFIQTDREEERRQFIDLITTAVYDSDSVVTVILTLRADFYDRPLSYGDLGALIQAHSRAILPLTLADLYDVILKPAAQDKVRVTLEPGLAEEMVFSVKDEAGALPLLQFTLDQLFQRREGLRLTHAAYRELGGVKGALTKHAEATYASLDSNGQHLARDLFLRLIEPGTTEQDTTRRRAYLSELTFSGAAQTEQFTRVQRMFVQAHLLITDQVAGKETIEVSHEALIREWERLNLWLREARSDVILMKRIAADAEEWSLGQREETLYRGQRLVDAQSWALRMKASAVEEAFIAASTEAVKRQIAAEERREKELHLATELADQAAKRAAQATAQAKANGEKAERQRRLTWIAGIFAVIIVIGTAVMSVFVVDRATKGILAGVAQQVQDSTNLNVSLQMAASANTVLQDQTADTMIAVLLAIRGLKAAYSPQADYALVRALESGYARQEFNGQEGAVTSVVFAADGETFLIGSWNKTAQLLTRDGKIVRTFSGHAATVTGVAFSSNGQFILTGSDDKTARLWNTATGKTIHIFAHEGAVTSVAFSPDARYALTGSYDAVAQLWDITTGKMVRSFKGHRGYVTSVAFSPDGRMFVTGSDDETVQLWDTETGERVRIFSGHNKYVATVAFSHDGEFLLTGSDDETAQLWDVETGERLRVFSGHNGYVTSVAFSPDDSFVLTGSYDRTARLWSTESGELIHAFTGHSEYVTSVAFSPDGRTFLTGSDDQTVRLWNASPVSMVDAFTGHEGTVKGVAFSPNSSSVATAGGDRTVQLWDIKTQDVLQIFSGHTGSVTSVAFSPDGRSVLTGSDDKTAQLWDSESGQVIRIFSGHTGSVTSVAFSPDGRSVLTGSDDKTARLWDVESGTMLRIFSGHTGSVTSVAFSPDGRSIVTGSGDRTARVWDTITGVTKQAFNGHTNWVMKAVFSPNGQFILTGSYDRTARLWDVTTGETVRILSGHVEAVWSTVFSPDGRFILTGSNDGSVKLWNSDTGETLRTFSGHTDAVGSVVFSPDSHLILTGSNDGTARLWDTEYYATIALACRHVWRDFTPYERQRFGITDQEPTCPQFATTESPVTIPVRPTSTSLPTSTIPVWTQIAFPTQEPTLTPTVTPLPTFTPAAFKTALIGENGGEIEVGGAEVWHYMGQSGERLLIDVRARKPAGTRTTDEERLELGLLDTFVVLRGYSGFYYQNDDNDQTTGNAPERTDSQLDVILPDDGLYEIEVRSFGNKSGGDYTLVIQSNRNDLPQESETLTVTAISSPSPSTIP